MTEKILQYRYFPVVNSTNDKIKELIFENQIPLPLAVRAGFQTHGRGQAENRWISAEGLNLLFSYGFQPIGLEAMHNFRVLVVISVALTNLLSRLGLEAKVKWPNDILVKGKKISGILIENTIAGKWVRLVIAGIGLNVNQTSFPDLPVNATSLKNEGLDSDPETLWKDLVEAIDQLIPTMATHAYSKTFESYISRLYRLNILSEYSDSTGTFLGTVRGVDSEGKLVITKKGGESVSYSFKEVEYR